ncbi:MAG: AI-2E family transporter [bacterium]|nr:AI-2E family transporter [bacterium]
MRKVEISPKTIVFCVLFILFLYVVWQVKDLIFTLFIAFIIMSALKPPVVALEKKGIPRTPAVLIVYSVFLLVIVALFSLILPPIISETAILIRSLPAILAALNPSLGSWIQLDSLTQYIPNVTNQVFQIASGVFSNFVFIVTTIFFGFYFLLDEDLIIRTLARFLEEDRVNKITLVLEKAEKRMNAWFWGELTLMTVVGIFTFIGLNLIGIRYALPLAVLAGLLEVVPNMGPVISAVPAVLIGMTYSYFTGFSTLALYFIIQQLENTFIVPIIMKRAVGLTPIVTLIALIVGGKLGGIMGILLAIPLFLFLETVLMGLRENKPFAEYLR